MKTKVSIILVCLIWMASSAYATVYNGVCGENVSWTLDSETKVLTISGTGKMFLNGQLFIIRDGKTYTLQGQEVR